MQTVDGLTIVYALMMLAGSTWVACAATRDRGLLSALEFDPLGSRRGAIRLLRWIGPLVCVAAWGLVATSEKSITVVPSPQAVLSAFVRLAESGRLAGEALVSIRRVAVGFSISVSIGVPLGLLIGSFVVFRRLLQPLTSFLRYIPPTAFVSLLIIFFGIGEGYKYSVIVAGTVFFIIQMIVDVIDDIDYRYIEMARLSGHTDFGIFRFVIIPYASPRIFDVLRINLSAAWTFLVAAELIGADEGLGHLVAISQRFLRLDELFVGIATFGVIGGISDVCLEAFGRRLFPWFFIALGQKR